MARGTTKCREAQALKVLESPAVKQMKVARQARESARNEDRFVSAMVDAVDVEAALASRVRGALVEGRILDSHGYALIYMPLHPRAIGGRVREHVVVAERKIGRLLVEGENVHHINGIRDDNRPENLELWTRPQPTGIRVEDAVAHAVAVLRQHAPELLNQDKVA